MVIAPDGQEYGPATVDALRLWAQENRLQPDTTLKDFASGRTMAASSVPGIFPSAPSAPPQVSVPAGPGGPAQTNWSQPPTAYPRGGMNTYAGYDTGSRDIWNALIRSVLAIVLFYVFNGIGLIVAVVGLLAAFRALRKGHKFGMVAVAISAFALLAVGIGWFFRVQHGGMYRSY